jgi:hypothetical protein
MFIREKSTFDKKYGQRFSLRSNERVIDKAYSSCSRVLFATLSARKGYEYVHQKFEGGSAVCRGGQPVWLTVEVSRIRCAG